jgi:hypothetical protein
MFNAAVFFIDKFFVQRDIALRIIRMLFRSSDLFPPALAAQISKCRAYQSQQETTCCAQT